ncbi:MAG TPA: hypothetical protein GX506_07520 [Firmicutes bacterium]|nr:hypothetical protein [Bacillota bacterium]
MELSREFRERYVKTLQGRDYIVYGGLLDLARRAGLRRISTHVVQIPSAENGMYAVVEAEVEVENGVFKEVGDASPGSVNRAIVPHLLRMAATRAKARALRDAVGVDMVALEELGDALPEDEIPSPPRPEEIVIGFGKYARNTLGEILDRDPGYVEWLRDNARDEVVRRAAKDLLDSRNTLQ